MFGFSNKARGAVFVDGHQVGETLQCVHCQFTWMVQPGSGNRRGWCNFCNGAVCGKGECMKHCTPFEARLDLSDAMAVGDTKEALKLIKKFEGIKPV